MTEPQKSASNRSRPQRSRRRGKKPSVVNAVQALKQAAPVQVSGPADEPLNPDEVRRMKATFDFLRMHRNTLKLRVNAVEDLLLNGKREPTHRGVCQHLLAKVDKDKVLLASERLPPAQATQLLAGVIRFAPDLVYVMRFLECVKASAGQKQATAALTQALGSIDFADASEAQIRHILALIVDIFPEKEQPVFLLSLLRGAAFRKAFDRSTEGLPQALAKILVPLRAVHQLVAADEKRRRGSRQRKMTADPQQLREGALLLMKVDQESLLEFNESVRRQLFQLLCELSTAEAEIPRDALLALFRSLHFANHEARSKSLLQFVGLLLRVGLEREAKGILKKELDSLRRKEDRQKKGENRAKNDKLSDSSQGERKPSPIQDFLALLSEPRIGAIALDPAPGAKRSEGKPSAKLPPEGRWYGGVHLQTQKALRVRYGAAGEGSDWAVSLQIWRRTLVPQVLLPRLCDAPSDSGRPYVAVERLASSFGRYLEGATAAQCESFLLDLCRIDAALNSAELRLPDFDLNRFAVDKDGRLWLADLLGVAKGSVMETEPSHLPSTIIEMAQAASSFSLSEAEQELVRKCENSLEVAELLGCFSE